MSKWKQLTEKLQGVFASVKVKADGYEVSFVKKVDTKAQKLVIVPYVNGEIKGEWYEAANGEPKHPEARFWFPVKRAIYRRKDYRALKRVRGKKEADRLVTPQVCAFFPYWNTPRSLVAHLKRNFPDLELVEESQIHE